MSAELPDNNGYFGEFGGRFAPEILMQSVLDLNQAWSRHKRDNDFQEELRSLLATHGGRETPLYHAEQLSHHIGGASIFLKREDLTSSGSHHINAALGQALLANKMGKSLLIAETSTGLHGIAVAQAAKIMVMDCQIVIGAGDASRQLNTVEKMRSLGASVSIVEPENASLLEANEETTRAWLGAIHHGFYVVNSVVGPHPYPVMVRDFQSVIGQEVMQQALVIMGRYPDHLVACVGGGSNAMGLFYPFLNTDVNMTGVEAAGTGRQVSRSQEERCGVYQGTKTLMRQDDNGQLQANQSLAVGLQTSPLGPEYSHWVSNGRIACEAISDQGALNAYQLTRELETITPALESAHAIAWGLHVAATLKPDNNIVINLSGRGEKDAGQILEACQ